MSNVTVDNKAVLNLFEQLNEDNRKSILFKALKKGGERLVNDTRAQLREQLGQGATTPNRWNGKTMESGIKLRGERDYCEVAVNIMGDFRLKFFEKGTKQRLTSKSNANRGSITALNFFQRARANETNITDNINSSINNSLNRLKQ